MNSRRRSAVLKLIASIIVGVTLALGPSCKAEAEHPEASSEKPRTLASVSFTVEGMHCATCPVAVRTALKRLDGVRDVQVSISEKRAIVDYDPAKITPQRMIQVINDLGYRANIAKGA